MEKHVTSLEVSKRLKALGVKQESEFYWVESQINHKWVIERKEMVRLEIFGDSATSAFLASELGEMLPATIGNKTWLSWVKSRNSFEDCYRISYDKWEHDKGAGLMLIKHVVDITMEKSMPDAFGLMLEYLIQNKLI
jgi:hypothetical protein